MSSDTKFSLCGGSAQEDQRNLTAAQAVRMQCYLPGADQSPHAVLGRLVDVVARTVATLHEKGVLEDFDMICILDNFRTEDNNNG